MASGLLVVVCLCPAFLILPVCNIFHLTYFGFLIQSYQTLCEKHPSFRERSENVDLVVEISLQPWNVFKPDGVRGLSAIETSIFFV